ncbi:MAG: alpha/beta fold hydrolase [Janthinobacterium lividum]
MTLFRFRWLSGYPLAAGWCPVFLSWLLLAGPCLAVGQALAHQTGKIATPQVTLGYESFGASKSSALPLLVVNGGPGLSHAYLLPTPVWQQVARKRQIIFYDQRGTGASRPVQPGAPQTLATQVADLEALRQGLNLPKVVLLGDSYGGLLVVAYASAHPEHVAKLVLSDAVGSSLPTMVHLFEQVFPDVLAAQPPQAPAPSPQAAAEAGLRTHFGLLFYSAAKRDAYFQQIGPFRNLGLEPSVGEAVEADANRADFTAQLAKFTFPTLVLSGRYDMNVAPLTAWRLKQAIPGAQLVFFEQSAHFPWFEEPAKYQTILEQFLEK